jgi:hypothetical protein
VTLLAATLPTNSTSSHLDPWKALCQRLPLYSQLAVTRLLNTENRCHSHKPALYGQSFTSIHQEFMWLSHQISEPTSHTPFSLMFSSTCLNHLVPSHFIHLFPLHFNSNTIPSILVLSVLVTWPNHCSLTLFCGLLSNTLNNLHYTGSDKGYCEEYELVS